MPMQWSLYPEVMEVIATSKKLQANWVCEECGRPCLGLGESAEAFEQRLAMSSRIGYQEQPGCFVLIVPQLDYPLENFQPHSLRALCSDCYCRYDFSQIARQQQLKAEQAGQLRIEGLDLFDDERLPPEVEADWIESELCSGGDNLQSYLSDSQNNSAIPGSAAQAKRMRSGGDGLQRSDLSPPEHDPGFTDDSRREDTSSYRRQHRAKGHASGWIESRTGNCKRRNPSTSYYYRWDSPLGRVCEYVRTSKLPQVHRLIEAEHPALEVLRVVTEGKKKRSRRVKELLGE